MPIITDIAETINTLTAIFDRHKNERVAVLGTICCGKTTLLKRIEGCVDLDDYLWPSMTEQESEFLSSQPWTKEKSDLLDRITYERVHIEAGRPMFTTVITDCEAVVYLDISDELLKSHCQARGVDFESAKSVKEAVEGDWNEHRAKGGKAFYYLKIMQ